MKLSNARNFLNGIVTSIAKFIAIVLGRIRCVGGGSNLSMPVANGCRFPFRRALLIFERLLVCSKRATHVLAELKPMPTTSGMEIARPDRVAKARLTTSWVQVLTDGAHSKGRMLVSGFVSNRKNVATSVYLAVM